MPDLGHGGVLRPRSVNTVYVFRSRVYRGRKINGYTAILSINYRRCDTQRVGVYIPCYTSPLIVSIIARCSGVSNSSNIAS